MERMWVFDSLAVAVAQIDFVDPAIADQPDARERGVRLEIRPADSVANGSAYVSTTVSLKPALCRIDLLESTAAACDRMHWHPAMTDGEPGDRVFDPALSRDPLGWLRVCLADVRGLLDDDAAGGRYGEDAAEIAATADEIIAVVRDGLARAREPWPSVEHDERGMART
jgi:hypothetical protein